MTSYSVVVDYRVGGRAMRARLMFVARLSADAMKHAQRWVEERTDDPIIRMVVAPVERRSAGASEVQSWRI